MATYAELVTGGGLETALRLYYLGWSDQQIRDWIARKFPGTPESDLDELILTALAALRARNAFLALRPGQALQPNLIPVLPDIPAGVLEIDAAVTFFRGGNPSRQYVRITIDSGAYLLALFSVLNARLGTELPGAKLTPDQFGELTPDEQEILRRLPENFQYDVIPPTVTELPGVPFPLVITPDILDELVNQWIAGLIETGDEIHDTFPISVDDLWPEHEIGNLFRGPNP